MTLLNPLGNNNEHCARHYIVPLRSWSVGASVGGLVWAFLGLSGAFCGPWRPWGLVWASLGPLRGPLPGLIGAALGPCGASARPRSLFGASSAPLGPLWRLFLRPWGLLEAPLRPIWVSVGRGLSLWGSESLCVYAYVDSQKPCTRHSEIVVEFASRPDSSPKYTGAPSIAKLDVAASPRFGFSGLSLATAFSRRGGQKSWPGKVQRGF